MDEVELDALICEEVRSVEELSVAALMSRVLRAKPELSVAEVNGALDRVVAAGTVVVNMRRLTLRAPGR